MPAGLTLGKVTVNGTGAVTVAFLCRVPDKIHSAKSALPINFLPCVLCRVPHSAKNLNPVVHELRRPAGSQVTPCLNASRASLSCGMELGLFLLPLAAGWGCCCACVVSREQEAAERWIIMSLCSASCEWFYWKPWYGR